MDSNQASNERRRSERLFYSLPVIVRGIDLLGQPFEERTTTLTINLHGCRYSSKYHLPINAWVTFEGRVLSSVRARVAWIQRPQSIRDFFQVAVEFDGPTDVWGLDSPPPDWAHAAVSKGWAGDRARIRQQESPVGTEEFPSNTAAYGARQANNMTDMNSSEPGFASEHSHHPASISVDASPLLADWNADIQRLAQHAVEEAAGHAAEQIHRTVEESERKHQATVEDFSQRWKGEFEQAQMSAREDFSAQLGSKHAEFLAGLKSEFEAGFDRGREILSDLDQKAVALRVETAAATDVANRMAEMLSQMAATEAPQSGERPSESPGEKSPDTEAWRKRLESETTLAQGQWNELLQSSLDSGMQRLAEQLSERSREVLYSTEQKISEHFAELRQPLADTAAQAREVLAGVRAGLEQEVGRARSSLAEIEYAASRIKEYSAQLEAASHDTLNELHRRTGNILETQTEEMNRRAEGIVTNLPQRFQPAIDSVNNRLVERTHAAVETKLAPHLERVQELIRELGGREVQIEENLRLYRERLRQVAENNQRDVAAQIAASLASLQDDFDCARKSALTKWTEELDTTGLNASHTVAESISQSSEWLQQEARARLQVLVEQTLAEAGGGLVGKSSEVARQFTDDLEARSSTQLAFAREQIEAFSGEIAHRTRTQMDEAGEAAAASFGQVLRGVSEQEIGEFAKTSRSALQERMQEFDRSAHELLDNLAASAEASLERFRSQMASQMEKSVAEGESTLAAGFASLLVGYEDERKSLQNDWAVWLERLSEQAAEKHQNRLEAASGTWMVSSVRRLNEHGQNVTESLMRSADQALRDSCSKVFEGLSEMIRNRTVASSAATATFIPPPNREVAETPHTSQ